MLDPTSAISRGEVSIAVIGAGAAGIAAGRRLAEAKIDFVVLEARTRLGGRAWTASLDGYALDLGCGWLHSADRNAWSKIAQAQGFTIDRTPAPWTTAERDLSFAPGEQKDFEKSSARFYKRLEEAAAAGKDMAAADMLEPGGRWNALLNAISSYANGAELELISVQDSARYEDTEVNWRVKEGYGTAIAAHGAGLPIMLDCVVTCIDHSARRVHIETSRGALAAQVVIVTLPTALIASGAVRFAPELPEKTDAAAAVPLGLADKVTLLFDKAEEVKPETRLFGKANATGIGAYHLRPFGHPLIEGYFGGKLARELEEAGQGALAAFAIDEIVGQLGGDLRARLKPLAATSWSRDPFARGSYSYAMPGKAGARAVLAQPVDDRLFFAGEACSPRSFSTAHGAYESGVAAAEDALTALARIAVRS